MKQDPEFLRTQSRSLHGLYRRQRRYMRWFILVWSLFFLCWFLVAVADVIGGFGWGYARDDIWNSLLFLAFGAGMWTVTSLFHGFLLAYVRHTYGPEPADD